jgi:hypothetical protein
MMNTTKQQTRDDTMKNARGYLSIHTHSLYLPSSPARAFFKSA